MFRTDCEADVGNSRSGTAEMNPTSIVSMRMCVQSLASLDRWGSPALPWLWRRPAAAAPIQPLAWEPPYASGGALKRQKTNKK